MADEIIYDTLGQKTSGNAGAIASSTSGFSFMTSVNGTGSLSDVQVSLKNVNTPTGAASSIDFSLYSSSGTNPGQKLADLGSISESSVQNTSTVFDIMPTTAYLLNPSTRYWVILSHVGSGGSTSGIDYEAGDAGSGSQGQFYSDGSTGFSNTGGADIAQLTENVVCFCTNTRIRTPRGDVAVEDLVVGDDVLTLSGAIRTIRWLGHRTIDCRAHPRPHEAYPVRVAAHAFGSNVPSRDLYMSQGHPVLVASDEAEPSGFLVPIMCLINGTTIGRVPVDRVTYWHVELDTHDILLAEGLSAESYLDWGNRAFFLEGDDHALADPDDVAPGLAGRCRPVVIDGPVVEAERRRLDMVFAMRLAGACAWPNPEDAFFALQGA